MSIKELRKLCQPAHKQKTDPLMEWYVLRPFSIYFTWLFIRLGVSANVVTFLGMIFGVLGSGCLLVGSLGWGLFGAVLIWFGFLFDCVDGEVSRYNKTGKISGIYLDYFVGGVNDMAIMLGLSFFICSVNQWDPRIVVTISVMLAFIEKIISLYAHSVVFRNIRSFWANENENECSNIVWKEMSIMQRLLRVPFETFFRATAILIAFILDFYFNSSFFITITWFGILLLGWFLVFRSFYSEFFEDRIGKTMYSFIGALKEHE